MLAALLLIILGVLTFLFWCYLQRKKYASLDVYDGPKPYPIIGNVLDFTPTPVGKLNDLMRYLKKYKYVVKVWLGPKNVYLAIADPKLTEFVASSPKLITKSVDYNRFHPWLGQGLLTATGSYWHKKRKILTPSFHFKILEEFLPVFETMGQIFIEKMGKKIGKGPFDIYPLVTAYTLDTICETAMGTSVDAQNKDSNYVRAVGEMRGIFLRRTFSAWKSVDSLFQFSSDYRLQKKCVDIMHGFTNSVIEKRKQEKRMHDVGSKVDDEDFGVKRRMVFLDLLLESKIDGRDWTDDEIREEVETFMFEGHDTTASAISFCLYELSNHPEVQEKAVKELNKIFGEDKHRAITFQDLQDMKYMELVIKETLRLYPSVPFFARQVEEDIEYEGTLWPAGLNLILFPISLQRREDIFKNASKFDPDRFLNESMNKQNSFIYIPFSAGPRNCIGQKFAMMEMKSAVAKVLMNYRLGPGSDKYPVTELSGEMILKSEEGLLVTLEKR